VWNANLTMRSKHKRNALPPNAGVKRRRSRPLE
jgi:hypothetical protein